MNEPQATPIPKPSPKAKARRRIRPMSDKRRAAIPTRAAVRAVVHDRDGGCVARYLVPEVQCWGPLDVDEAKPRSLGGDPLNPDDCQVLCRAHHDWKGEHGNEAHVLGLHRRSWE